MNRQSLSAPSELESCTFSILDLYALRTNPYLTTIQFGSRPNVLCKEGFHVHSRP
jgi:hypothetical protein